jgi:hypothetical protein
LGSKGIGGVVGVGSCPHNHIELETDGTQYDKPGHVRPVSIGSYSYEKLYVFGALGVGSIAMVEAV